MPIPDRSEYLRNLSTTKPQPSFDHFSVQTGGNELDDEFTPLNEILFDQQDKLDLATRYMRIKGDIIHVSFREIHLTIAQHYRPTRVIGKLANLPNYSDERRHPRSSGTLAVFEIQEGLLVATEPFLDEDIKLEDGMLGIVLADPPIASDGMLCSDLSPIKGSVISFTFY